MSYPPSPYPDPQQGRPEDPAAGPGYPPQPQPIYPPQPPQQPDPNAYGQPAYPPAQQPAAPQPYPQPQPQYQQPQNQQQQYQQPQYPPQQPGAGYPPDTSAQSGGYPGQQQYPGTPYPAQQYPYGQQPSQPGYPAAPAPPTAPHGVRSVIIATTPTVAVLAAFCVYWFGFRTQNQPVTPTFNSTSPTPLTSPSPSPTLPSASVANPFANPSSTAGIIPELQELEQAATDPGCKAAYAAVITYRQQATAAGNDAAAQLLAYSTVVNSLKSAKSDTANPAVAAAIGNLITNYQNQETGQPTDTASSEDVGEQFILACL